MTSQDPTGLVSILIHSRNHAPFVQEAIESALNQTYEAVEIVIVDEGSTDHSCNLIEHYAAIANRDSERIVPVFKDNIGEASALNAGIQTCQGDIVCLLDANDTFAADKALKVVRYFDQYPKAGWLFHALEAVDRQGKVIADDGDRPTIHQFSAEDFRPTLAKGLPLPAFPATTGLCFRHTTLRQMRTIPESLQICTTPFLPLAATCIAPGLLVPEPLATQRVPPQALHNNPQQKQGADLQSLNAQSLNAQSLNAQFLNAETDIKTAYYLRQQFPGVQRYADRLFSNGMGQLLSQAGIDYSLSLPEAKAYLKENLGIRNSLGCSFGIAYQYWQTAKAS